jgi:hypothetical protein
VRSASRARYRRNTSSYSIPRNGTWTLFKQAIDETTAEVPVEGHSLYVPCLSADVPMVRKCFMDRNLIRLTPPLPYP